MSPTFWIVGLFIIEMFDDNNHDKEYSLKDAVSALQKPIFQFTLAGNKPVRGIPSGNGSFELNSARRNEFVVVRRNEGGFMIIIPLQGRVKNCPSGKEPRQGDTFTIILRNASDEEAKEIATIIGNNVRFDYQGIMTNDAQEGLDVLQFVAKMLPGRMNKKMTMTESQIKQIIREEVEKLILTGQKKKKDMDDVIASHGIVNPQQLSIPGCGIGFAPQEQKWYGWSNNAIYGFSLGSTLKKSDCGYQMCRIKQARTLQDAQQMAIAFAMESAKENQQAVQGMV